jgi:nitrogen fixation NifU-like protein
MNDLGDLYQQVILDHNRQPRNFGEVKGSNRTAVGHNPLCGDRLTLYARIEDGVVRAVGFIGSGCAISKASASMMTEAIKGKKVAEVEEIFRAFHGLVTEEPRADGRATDLGKLVVFSGVREFPVRVKCATLAWHTLRAALENRGDTTTTE